MRLRASKKYSLTWLRVYFRCFKFFKVDWSIERLFFNQPKNTTTNRQLRKLSKQLQEQNK